MPLNTHRPGDYLSRRNRLLQIDQLLRKGKPVTYARLARKFGVTKRTMQRDFDILKDELNAPLIYDAGKGGWVYTDRSFSVPATTLTGADLFAVLVAKQAVEQYRGTPLHQSVAEAFERLMGSMPVLDEVALRAASQRVCFAGLPPVPIASKIWNAVVAGVTRNLTLEIVYRSPSQLGWRRIDPYGLLTSDQVWYATAFCHTRRMIRTFSLPRIEKVRLTKDAYEWPEGFDFQAYVRSGFEGFRSSSEPQYVRLRFSKDASPAASEQKWHPEQSERWDRQGRLTIAFETDATFKVLRRILSWGKDIEVLGPVEIRRHVLEHAKAVLQSYRSNV